MGSVKHQEWKDSKFFHLADKVYRENQLKILELLRETNGDKLLDIGCAGGAFSLECAKMLGAKEICGIEIDENRAKEAENRGIRVFAMDASNTFPFKDEYFDVIVANQVLEHVLDVDNMLRESYRVLKQGGVVVLSTPNLCSLLQRILILFGKQPTTLHVSEIQVGNFLKEVSVGEIGKQRHIHAFAPPALKDLVKYHGFKVENFLSVGFYPFPSKIAGFLTHIAKNHGVNLTIKVRK